jgi:hypothetical protein
VPTDEDTSRVLNAGPTWSGEFKGGRRVNGGAEEGRYPANVLHDGSDEVLEAFAAFGDAGGQDKRPVLNRAKRRAGEPGKANKDGRSESALYGDTGTAARFFAKCEFADDETFIRSAKSIMQAWNQQNALTAENPSSLSSERAAIALSDAVTWASHGASRLSDVTGLTTSVTPNELRLLGESVITATLSTERRCSPGLLLARSTETPSPATCAVNQTPSGTTTITVSHWKSDGSARPVTFSITPTCSEPGVLASESILRFNYCAKASKSERGEGNTHATVKPITLMRWCVRLVCPPRGTVLDPFAGSGTTLLAAQREGREAVGVELDAGHCEIIRSRLTQPAEVPESAPSLLDMLDG